MDKLDIINRALMKCALPLAATLSDCDWNAQTVFDNCVEELLRNHAWNFCQNFKKLTRASVDPPFGYSYSYEIPDDCMKVIDCRCAEDLRAPKARFSVVTEYLYCNASPCNCRYVYRCLDPAKWRPDFCDAAAARIAVEIAGLSAQKVEMIPQLKQLAELALSKAIYSDAKESVERVLPDPSIYAARETAR